MCASYSQGKLTYDDVNAVLGSTEYAKVADICGAIGNGRLLERLARFYEHAFYKLFQIALGD